MKHLIYLTMLCFVLVQCKDDPTNPDSGDIAVWLQQNAPTSESFTFNAGQTQYIQSKNGYQYTIWANSLRDGMGNTVIGDVELTLLEVTNKAEMIYSGVTTTSDYDLLESAGMFKLEVSKDGQELFFGEPFRVNVPINGGVNPNLRVFWGEETSGDPSVNWILADSTNVGVDTSRNDSTNVTYYFDIAFTSWCNLDAYYNATTGSQVRFQLPEGYDNSNTRSFIIFKDNNTVAMLFYDSDDVEFNSGNYNLPLGWEIQLLAISTQEDELHYALVDSEIVNDHLEVVDEMIEISEEDLKDLIDSF